MKFFREFVYLVLVLFLFLIEFPQPARASEFGCDNRYLTLVNPVRSRKLWQDSSMKPIADMYSPINNGNFYATWLLQYDVFGDAELLSYIKQFNEKQEKGVFLEVSPTLAQDAKVFYDSHTAWYHPEVVFLSAYSQSERLRLIDRQFEEFKKNFGVYPTSVGAWWIDSYSLSYIQKEYGVNAVLIVADQLSTDRYGVWGQWWGVPYFPSKANVLVPAQSDEDKLPAVVVQWAQRHGEKAYGDTPAFSNYSLQANDYIRLGLDTIHFKDLVNYYLQCSNKVGQITVGLEVGQESVPFIDEYYRQLDYLQSISNMEPVTMSQFWTRFSGYYPNIIEDSILESTQSAWVMDTRHRENIFLKDSVSYSSNRSFPDYFLADTSGFLDRKLNTMPKGVGEFYYPLYLLMIIGFAIYFYFTSRIKLFFISTLLLFGLFGLLLKSHQQFGWLVFYGASLGNLMVLQAIVVLIFYPLVLVLSNKWSRHILLLNLSVILGFSIDFVLSLLRYTVSEQGRIFGISFDGFKVFGVAISSVLPSFYIHDFPAHVAGALRTVPLERIYQNFAGYFLLNPILHILFGLCIYFSLLKLNRKWQIAVILMLIVPVYFYYLTIINADPVAVR